MSLNKYKRIATALAIASIPLFLVGCGSGNNSTPVPGVGGIPGSVYGTPGAPGTCVPISQQIPFTANNIYLDWANIVGGAVPMSSTSIGQILVGGVPMASTGATYQRSGVDGTLVLNANPMNQFGGQPYPSYPQGTWPAQYPMPQAGPQANTASGTGFIQISPQTQQDIMYRVQLGQIPIGNLAGPSVGYPGYPSTGYPNTGYPQTGYGIQPSQICVSQIAINVGHYNNLIYGGNVYIYLNGSQHGYVLYY